MGVPGADVRYVLESLKEIEAALGNETCKHKELGMHCTPECPPPGHRTEALELLRTLKEELEAIK